MADEDLGAKAKKALSPMKVEWLDNSDIHLATDIVGQTCNHRGCPRQPLTITAHFPALRGSAVAGPGARA